MRRRGFITVLVLATLALAATFWPSATFACQINDPGCYIDDIIHKRLYDFNLSIWQINRAGLTLARWFEDLRLWLIESVMVNVFTTLSRPVIQFFTLALIVAWMVFIISFMVQSFVDFRWVDIRRTLRPILLAWLIYQFGGNFVLWTENVRLLGGSLLQQTAQEVTATFEAPSISSAGGSDMPDASRSIYASTTSCGTSKRAIEAMYLNDYAARYLWSSGDDVHCADLFSLAGEFGGKYFAQRDISSESDPNKRQTAVGWAAQGGLRQVTGLFMTAGAIVEQIDHLVFALSLALVWFGLLISLVFAVFLPTEVLLGSQIKAILTVLRGSWLASLLIGLGLAVLRLVAASGNGFLMFFCGLVLIAVCVWQGKQALLTVGTAMSSVNTVMGSAPSAVGGMVRSWATTAAVVGGAAASGDLREVVGKVTSTMVRRMGRNVGDNQLSQAAGRVLANRLADKLDARIEDRRLERDAELSTQEAAWYERKLYDDAGDPAIDAEADRQRARSQERARQQLAHLKERQAERARKGGNFRKADRLRREARRLGGDGAGGISPDGDGLDLEAAVERLYEAEDDEEMQRRVLADVAAQAQRRAQLKAVRNRALREKRFEDAKAAIRDLRAMDAADAQTQPGTAASAPNQSGAPRGGRRARVLSSPRRVSAGSGAVGAASEPVATEPPAAEQAPLQGGRQQITVTKGGGAAAINGRRLVKIQNVGESRELHLEDGSVVTLRAEEYRDMLRVGQRIQDGDSFSLSGFVSPAASGRTQVAAPSGHTGGAPASARLRKLRASRQRIEGNGQGAGVPAGAAGSQPANVSSAAPGDAAPTTGPEGSSGAAPGTSSPSVANGAPLATNQPAAAGAPPAVVQGGQSSQGRSAGAGGQRERVGAATNGATSVDGAAGRPLRAADAAPAAAGVSNVPDVSPMPAAATRPAEQPEGSPPASTSIPAAPGAVSAPTAPASASASAAPPAASAPVAEIAPAPSSASAPATSATVTPLVEAAPRPATSAPAPVSTPAPRATNGLPVASSGTAVPAPAQAAPAQAAEAKQPAVQPARAASGPALPKVPEVQRREEAGRSRPAPAAPSGAAASRRPWKRGKGGNS